MKHMKHLMQFMIIINFLWCGVQGKEATSPKIKSTQIPAAAFTLTSAAFNHNEKIPSKYTGDGENISPHLQWSNPPAGTKSYALVMQDPDAEEKAFVHWLIFNIPSTVTELAEGTPTKGFVSGTTDFYYTKHGVWLYGGPYPPTGTHHYHFTLYAIDTMLELSQDAEKSDLVKAMEGHVLAQATLVGLYERKGA